MSAAARPKRWGVFRQAKVRSHHGLFTLSYLTGRAIKDTWSNLGEAEGKKIPDIHKWIAFDGSELVPTTDVENILTYPIIPCRPIYAP
jgi:hypothetical protein